MKTCLGLINAGLRGRPPILTPPKWVRAPDLAGISLWLLHNLKSLRVASVNIVDFFWTLGGGLPGTAIRTLVAISKSMTNSIHDVPIETIVPFGTVANVAAVPARVSRDQYQWRGISHLGSWHFHAGLTILCLGMGEMANFHHGPAGFA